MCGAWCRSPIQSGCRSSTGWAFAIDAIARGIAIDKGGEANLSTVEKHLIENFAGIAVVINDNIWTRSV